MRCVDGQNWARRRHQQARTGPSTLLAAAPEAAAHTSGGSGWMPLHILIRYRTDAPAALLAAAARTGPGSGRSQPEAREARRASKKRRDIAEFSGSATRKDEVHVHTVVHTA